MGSLESVRASILNSIQSEDVSKYTPAFPRFEVENITHRKNSVIEHDVESGRILIYNTSRGAGNVLDATLGPRPEHFPEQIPVEFRNAKAFFEETYRKSLKGQASCCFIHNTWFMGYVDENFQPIESKD